MNDSEFLRALENCTLAPDEFGHIGHVRACYLYLHSQDFVAALLQIRTAIRRYAAALGKPERYHETMTVAYAALIHEHLDRRGDGGNWENFLRHNPELFAPGLLLQFYSPSQLDSARARRMFLMPRPDPDDVLSGLRGAGRRSNARGRGIDG